MAFIRVWVCCAWVRYCEGLICQVLAKKGAKRLVQMLEPQVDVLTIAVHNCWIRCLILLMCHIYFVTCDLSYKHSCDLCSELQRVVFGYCLRGPSFYGPLSPPPQRKIIPL